MYINKVVFLEREEFTEEFNNLNSELGVVQFTDYDTYEITADHLQELVEELQADNENMSEMSFEEAVSTIKEAIGSDAYEALMKDEIDFCLVV